VKKNSDEEEAGKNTRAHHTKEALEIDGKKRIRGGRFVTSDASIFTS